MKLTRALLAAAATAAFALPASAQVMTGNQPATTPPVAQPADPAMQAPAMQPATQPPVAADSAQPAHQPTTQTAPAAAPALATPPAAVAADLVVGARVLDGQGQPVGTIETADATGAVVTTGNARGRLNLDAFFKDDRGLLIGYTRTQFEALVTGMGGPEAAGEAADEPAAASAGQPAEQRPEAPVPPGS